MLFEPDVRFHILVKFGSLSSRLLENTSSAYDMFYWYKYRLGVNLDFSHPSVFGVGISF